MVVNDRKTRSFAAQWASYRRRRNLALVLLYSLVPCWIISLSVVGEIAHFEILSVLLAGVWTAATAASLWWAGQFRCPRCSRRFGALGSKGFFGRLSCGVFDDICNNCRLRKFIESD